MKAAIFTRVSTEEQKEAGNSLPAQLHRLRTYAQQKGFIIEKEWSIDESAYKINRDDFSKFIESIRELTEKEPVALCCDKIDRLLRNFSKELVVLEELRAAGKIELHFPSDNVILHKNSPASDLFRFTMGVSLAKYYSDSISDNVRRSIEQKLRNREWPGKAPIGYLNTDLPDGKKWVVPNPKTKYLVISMFEWYATGNYSMLTLSRKIDDEFGIIMPKGQIDHILKNPFYYGEMLYDDKIYPHAYDPLISRYLYNKVQEVKASWNKKPFKYAAKPFAYRGLITCIDCGCIITPEESKGHAYYHCTQARGKHGAEWLREEELTEQFSKLLKGMSIPRVVLEELVAALKASHEDKKAFYSRRVENLKEEHARLEQRIERMYEDYLDGRITREFYDKKLPDYEKRKQMLMIEIEQHDEGSENYYINAAKFLELAGKACETFESSKVEEKRQLLNYLLQNCNLRGRKLEFILRKPFDVILTHAKTEKWLPGMDSNHRPSA